MKAASRTEQNYPIIIGGNFNVIHDPDLDGRGGNNKKKDSAKSFEDMHLDFDLVDICRIRNPTISRFDLASKNSGFAEAYRLSVYKRQFARCDNISGDLNIKKYRLFRNNPLN